MEQCGTCGYTHDPIIPVRDRRALITVVDELGSDEVCALCAVSLLSSPGVTLLLAGAALHLTA